MKWVILSVIVMSTAQALERKCRTVDDCEDGECCATPFSFAHQEGYCQTLKEEGESCSALKEGNDQKSKVYIYWCPCREGLHCFYKEEMMRGHLHKYDPRCVVPKNE